MVIFLFLAIVLALATLPNDSHEKSQHPPLQRQILKGNKAHIYQPT